MAQTPSIEQIALQLKQARYLAGEDVAAALHLSLKLDKPLLVEGVAGCGKTELAKVLSTILNTDLIRLQCYEGLDSHVTIYEWDYLRQLLAIRIREGRAEIKGVENEIFSERYLLKRPLLQALLNKERPPVLLIDELDRADEEFEGFLLEFLAEFQVTIPELGTLRATYKPYVIITSNRTREIGDGIRRRCLYLYVTYPDPQRELQIVKTKIPELDTSLSRQIVDFVQKVREIDDLQRHPGVSETLDWANSFVGTSIGKLDAQSVSSTMSCLIKDADDIQKFTQSRIQELLSSRTEKVTTSA